MEPDERSETNPTPSGEQPPRPRWVRWLLLALVIAVLVVLVVMLLSGGEHGPGRHS